MKLDHLFTTYLIMEKFTQKILYIVWVSKNTPKSQSDKT